MHYEEADNRKNSKKKNEQHSRFFMIIILETFKDSDYKLRTNKETYIEFSAE